MLVLIVLIFRMTMIFSISLNPKGPTHQNYSSSCIIEVIKNQFVPDYKLLTVLTTYNMSAAAFGIQNKILTTVNHLLRWPLEVLSGKRASFESAQICLNCPPKEGEEEILKNIFQPNYRAAFCVMVVDNFEDFSKRFDNFVISEFHNFHAFFLVYISEVSGNYAKSAKDILVFLWERNIFNSAVIISKNSLKTLNIYGLDAYAPSEFCGQNPKLLLMDTCKKGKNCSIETVTMEYPPFIISSDEGFEVNVLKQLGNILNITFRLAMQEDVSDWGVRLSKNNWTGPLQEALEKSAIAIGNVMANPDLEKDFDMSIGYFYEHMIWVAPVALPIERWKNIFVILKYELWLVTFFYFVLTAILFQILGTRFNNELRYFKQLSINFMTALRLLIGNASPRQPQTMMVRTIFMSLTSYSMLMVVLYESLLITHLLNPVYEKQISTVQDILDSGKNIGGLKSYRRFFNTTGDERAMKIYNMFEVNDTAYNWLLSVADDRDTCTVLSRFYVKYLLAEHDPVVTTRHGKEKIFVLQEILVTYPIRMVLPKGFPLGKRFNRVIWNLLNGGIIEHWANSYHQHMKKQNDTDEDHNDEILQKLTIDHLQGAFNLLFFGCVFGIGFLLFELIFSKIKKAKKYEKLKRSMRNKRKLK